MTVTLQTLIATMNREQYDFLSAMQPEGEVIVVNQCGREAVDVYDGEGFRATILSTTQRGLSNSRNEAILHCTADFFLTGDDDITYRPGYAEMIVNKFAEHPEADVIAFNIERHNLRSMMGRRQKHPAWREAPKNRYYPSVSVAYRKAAYDKANLHFHPLFGAGALYRSGEESLVLRQARQAGLTVYESPEVIADVDFSQSTWFDGYDEKYFFDKGAWLKCAYPRTCWLMKYYYLVLKKRTTLSTAAMLRAMCQGMKSLK